uniref:uncharacterized protein LOC118526169 n=1 Tax=Halichoerus grypus TaxID=9711 RepID=UPI001659AEAF|nr:uncharacterized protein LOC118526169 [Halichoerus grypus]
MEEAEAAWESEPATEGGNQRFPGAHTLANMLFQPQLNSEIGNRGGWAGEPSRRQPRMSRVLESGFPKPASSGTPQEKLRHRRLRWARDRALDRSRPSAGSQRPCRGRPGAAARAQARDSGGTRGLSSAWALGRGARCQSRSGLGLQAGVPEWTFTEPASGRSPKPQAHRGGVLSKPVGDSCLQEQCWKLPAPPPICPGPGPSLRKEVNDYKTIPEMQMKAVRRPLESGLPTTVCP